jgi:hypothetical protein
MNIEKTGSPETPENYQHTPRSTSEERIPQLHSGGILKSRMLYFTTHFTIDNKKARE